MKSHNNPFMWYIMATLICFFLFLETTSNEIGLEQAIEQQLNSEQIDSEEIYGKTLNRKRRYLEFPEGSSFQLVYDLIVGVVDYTNYLILGVTVALAWELPTKPPSEIFDDFTERLKDGTLGTSRNDSVKNIKYTNLKSKLTTSKTSANIFQYKLQPMLRPPMHYQYYTSQTPDNFYRTRQSVGNNSYGSNRYNVWSKNDINYNSPNQIHPFKKWIQSKNPKVKGIKYPWWNLPERLKNSFIKRPNVRRFDKNYNRPHFNNKTPKRKTFSTFQGAGSSEHRVYPVFGKRSISYNQAHSKILASTHARYRRSGVATEQPLKLDRIHIEHHRRTRHDLYQRIETYLNGRGSHGHHCVLRALCETGQKSNERTPGSFVGELMRAIFTMPEPLDTNTVGYQEQRYDTANALKGDCASRYNLCKDSLWSSHFVL